MLNSYYTGKLLGLQDVEIKNIEEHTEQSRKTLICIIKEAHF